MIGIFLISGGGSGGSGDLQAVCDIGNNTNTGIILNGNGLTVINPVTGGNSQNISFQQNQFNEPGSGFNLIVTYPPTLSADQVIEYQDGSGTIAFLSDIGSQDLQSVLDVGNISTTGIQLNGATVATDLLVRSSTTALSTQIRSDGIWLHASRTNTIKLVPTNTNGTFTATFQARTGTIALLSDIPAGSIGRANYTGAITVGSPTLVVITVAGNPTYVGGITPKNADTAANFYNTLGYTIAYGVGRFTVTFYIGTGVFGTTWDFDYLISFT